MKRNLLLLAALLGLSVLTNTIALRLDLSMFTRLFGPIGTSQPVDRTTLGTFPTTPPMARAPQRSGTTTGGPGARGMTWGVVGEANRQSADAASVGCGGRPSIGGGAAAGCNAYAGDTSCEQALPMLCLSHEALPEPVPAGGAPSGVAKRDYYSGWSGARLALSRPIRGKELNTAASGDGLCTAELGKGWRMAEFHDGGGGWGLRGRGHIAASSRFWVRINDQPANCWNSASR